MHCTSLEVVYKNGSLWRVWFSVECTVRNTNVSSLPQIGDRPQIEFDAVSSVHLSTAFKWKNYVDERLNLTMFVKWKIGWIYSRPEPENLHLQYTLRYVSSFSFYSAQEKRKAALQRSHAGEREVQTGPGNWKGPNTSRVTELDGKIIDVLKYILPRGFAANDAPLIQTNAKIITIWQQQVLYTFIIPKLYKNIFLQLYVLLTRIRKFVFVSK